MTTKQGRSTVTTSTTEYCPYRHAEQLGATIEYRRLSNPRIMAAYSPDTDRIYIRPGLTPVVERCALAHEIVHFEHGDQHSTCKTEGRAKRISARRLICQTDLERLLADTLDLQHIARELDVTVRTLTTYLGIPDEVVDEHEKVA